MSLSVKDLSFTYHAGTPLARRALDAVSFEMDSGRWMAVVGPTGSGKSTLAQHLNALILPQEGKVTVDGLVVAPRSPDLREVRRRVGLVFQYPEQQLFAENVYDEVAFAPRNWGVDEGRLEALVARSLAQVGLETSLSSRSPFSLSGGQKRRVALASVLAAEPEYLVLDEPTAGLDGGGVREFLSLIAELVRGGMGVLQITHDLELALSRCDAILVLDHGRVLGMGSPQDLVDPLCRAVLPGLIIPPVLDFSRRLRERGLAVPLTMDAEELGRRLEKGGRY